MNLLPLFLLLLLPLVISIDPGDYECEEVGGKLSTDGTVCCDAKCKWCDSEHNCGNNGGNPKCCVSTILHNYGLCVDSLTADSAPCVKSDIPRATGPISVISPYRDYSEVDGSIDPVTWESVAFIVQISGTIEYGEDGEDWMGANQNYEVATIADSRGCPLFNQVFPITSVDGLSVSVEVSQATATGCTITLKSWQVPIMSYRPREETIYFSEHLWIDNIIQEEACTEWGGCDAETNEKISIFSSGDQSKFELDGCVYISNAVKMLDFDSEEPDVEDEGIIGLFTSPSGILLLWILFTINVIVVIINIFYNYCNSGCNKGIKYKKVSNFTETEAESLNE